MILEFRLRILDYGETKHDSDFRLEEKVSKIKMRKLGF